MKNIFRFLAATTSVLTMVFSPVAQGLGAQQNLKQQIEMFMVETQLNQRVTYKQFWDKTKHLYSGQIYSDVERYLMATPNELMPEFTLKESLSSTGEKIPTLTISEKGKSHTLQIFGDKAKFAKFNNVVLSENDIMLVTPAMKRIMASDIKIKKEHDRKLINANKDQFTGFPALDQKTWKNMSQKDRAMYVLLMRQTWTDARRVLEIIDQEKESQTTPDKKKKTSKLENLIKFLESEVWAAAGKDGEGCLVAGYVSEYKSGVCSSKMISKHYDDSDVLVKKTMEYCASKTQGSISCNPYIYGTSIGIPTCIVPSRDVSFQKATHASGPCDTQSPLGKPADFKFLKDPNLTGPERYADANLIKGNDGKPLSLEAEYKRQQTENTNYVENYLKGILKFNSGGKEVNFDEALSNETLAQILDIKEQFDQETANAVENCKKDVTKKHEKNFWEACDQMQRRFLFVAEFLTKKPGCPDNKSVNPNTLKCPCEGGGEANPGAQCVAVTPTEPPVEASVDCGEKYPGLGTTVSDDGKSCLCENGKEPSGEPAECKSGFNWKPWLIGVGIVATAGLLWWLTHRDKDKKKTVILPAGGCKITCGAGTTKNPTTCACDPDVVQPPCSAPLDPVTCQCPVTNACTPGQQIYNLSTCQCDNVAQPGVCPDGVTSYVTPPGPTSCPAPTTCQNGTQVYPPQTCPAVNEGGSGSNPNDSNSGGVPTGN